MVEHAHCGIDLQDALPKLLDLRFADDILLFAGTAHETVFLLESLLQEFAAVGLLLNGEKTVASTNEAQPPSHLWTRTGIKLHVKNGSGGHKWFGCILGVGKARKTTVDLNHHLQAASKAFFANKAILCDRNVHVKDRRCESGGAFWLWAPYCPPEGPTSIRRCLSQISTCGGWPTFER